jgi:hypothetical protein
VPYNGGSRSPIAGLRRQIASVSHFGISDETDRDICCSLQIGESSEFRKIRPCSPLSRQTLQVFMALAAIGATKLKHYVWATISTLFGPILVSFHERSHIMVNFFAYVPSMKVCPTRYDGSSAAHTGRYSSTTGLRQRMPNMEVRQWTYGPLVSS